MAQMSLFALLLLTSFTGALAQFTLTQPPSLSASLGETVSLTCARTGGSFSDRYVHWHQQKPGNRPLLLIYKDSERPSGIPERFSGSVDTSSNVATLSISNIRAEDEADYYCSSSDSSEQSTVIQPYGELRQKPRRCLCPAWNFHLVLVGIDAQPTWSQLSSSSVSPGGTATLPCTTTQSTYWIGWYQQKSGEGPRFVHCDTCSNRGPGIPDRFTATRSGSSGSLTITNAQAEDEADYYCGSWNSAVTVLHGGRFFQGSVTETFTFRPQHKRVNRTL
ncbi:uncharacterized protein LOC134505884 [Candoia aspera]|uniref:uncharacterized protein LOC134505884 n=1 Tax=Candoia aspera TaxID=51853 RepID=UPI002FD823B9